MTVIIIRAVILYILIMLSLRLMGKRQLGELQPSELVITILISNIASLPLENISTPLFVGFVPVLSLVCLDVFMSGLMLKSHKFRRLVSGNPVIIISDGKINQGKMKELRFSIDDLFAAMRANMIFDIEDIQYAIVENNGNINFYQRFEARGVENRDLKLSEKSNNPPAILIKDGEMNILGLQECNFTDEWLQKQIKNKNLKLNEIFLMTADKGGIISIVKKEGKKH